MVYPSCLTSSKLLFVPLYHISNYLLWHCKTKPERYRDTRLIMNEYIRGIWDPDVVTTDIVYILLLRSSLEDLNIKVFQIGSLGLQTFEMRKS